MATAVAAMFQRIVREDEEGVRRSSYTVERLVCPGRSLVVRRRQHCYTHFLNQIIKYENEPASSAAWSRQRWTAEATVSSTRMPRTRKYYLMPLIHRWTTT